MANYRYLATFQDGKKIYLTATAPSDNAARNDLKGIYESTGLIALALDASGPAIITHRCGFLGCTNPVKEGERCVQHVLADNPKTPAQLCTLRELVLSYQAFIRSRNEFFTAIGYDTMHEEDACTTEREMAAWLEERAPADGRDVSVDTLHYVFCFLPTDGK